MRAAGVGIAWAKKYGLVRARGPESFVVGEEGTRLASCLAREPAEVWLRLKAKYVGRQERRGRPYQYPAEADWERRLHEILGVPWPCPAAAEFWALWPEVIGLLAAKGLRAGVGHFGGWNDGDPGLVRAVWCLTRHLRPANVVETGVARGMTSRFILEALGRNGAGHLWSIDRPPALATELHGQIGAAVEGHCRSRWSYVEGSSRHRLPGLLASLGSIDLFVHDSLHTASNIRFELDQAWRVLKPGGIVVADDIDLNPGFRFFIHTRCDHPAVICSAEPLEPEPLRFNGTGLFGLVQKKAATDRAARE
jgi:hypothetical protein